MEPASDYYTRIERFMSEIEVVNMTRILKIRGNNGRLYTFRVQFTPNIPELFSNPRSEERTEVFTLSVKLIVLALFTIVIPLHK